MAYKRPSLTDCQLPLIHAVSIRISATTNMDGSIIHMVTVQNGFGAQRHIVVTPNTASKIFDAAYNRGMLLEKPSMTYYGSSFWFNDPKFWSEE